MAHHRKFIVAIVGGLIAGLLTYYEGSAPEWLNYAVFVATALGVYRVPNKQ